MKYFFHPDAEKELNSAVDYYEECKAGLGLQFLKEVLKAIQMILEFPTAWQKIDGETRRCLVNRFPFGVIYYKKDTKIIILAVMQLQREPDYWKKRKSNKFQ